MSSLNEYLQNRDIKKVNYSIEDLRNECQIEHDSSESRIFHKHIKKCMLVSELHPIPPFVSTRRGRQIICAWLENRNG